MERLQNNSVVSDEGTDVCNKMKYTNGVGACAGEDKPISNLQLGRQRIDSLQALRAWAFLGIFFYHAMFFVSWPSLGVCIFFVMSGFLMMYRYENVEIFVSPKNNLIFSLNRIKKLYPLHVITTIFAIALSMVIVVYHGIDLKSVIKLIAKIGLNLTLLQTWVPHHKVNVSLNGVAWYLSVTMFLYFMFPWIRNMIKSKSIIQLLVICGIVLIVEIVSCIPFIMFLGKDSPVYIWFMYCFPFFRLGDFFIGCVLKRLFSETNVRFIGGGKATIIEMLACIVTVLVLLWITKEQSNVFLCALHNPTTIFIPIAAIWVLLFAINQGLLTKMLSNKLTIFIGNISAYAFLIHYVITQYVLHLLSYMNIEVNLLQRTILVFAELVVSIEISVLYKKFHDKYIVHHFFEQEAKFGK